jgi:hypothetical protein
MVTDNTYSRSERAGEAEKSFSIMSERIETLLLMACFGNKRDKCSAVRELSRRRLTEEMDGYIDFPAILSGFCCSDSDVV